MNAGKSKVQRTKSKVEKKIREVQSSKDKVEKKVKEKKAIKFDLEERTFVFARNVRSFIRKVPKGISNNRDAGQLNDASGSVGANYREAQEAVSRKDFFCRISICRKEAKESAYWLRLLFLDGEASLEKERNALMKP